MKDPIIDRLAERIWDYLRLNQTLVQSDCIFVLGSRDTRPAERAAEIYLDGWAPWILFSGGAGAITREVWDRPEAEIFAEIAMEKGVPEDRILKETESSNTGDNLRFSRRLLTESGLDFQRFIVVQKPYMERRAFATFKKEWPDKDLVVTSPSISYQDYPNDEISKDDLIHGMVGDLQRIRVYPEMGFQIPQQIPTDVWKAYEQLVQLGYDRRVIRDARLRDLN